MLGLDNHAAKLLVSILKVNKIKGDGNMARNGNAIEWDEEFIRKNYNSMTLVEMAKILSIKEPRINPKNLSRQCKKMNLTKLIMLDSITLKEDEEFKIIPGFSNYKVSQYGTVYNVNTNAVIADIVDRRGYHIRKITDDNNIKRDMPLHRLIAFAWIQNDDPENKIQVDHIDGNKENNNISNLEWVTPQENIHRARTNNLNNSKPSDNEIMKYEDVVKLYLYCKNNPNCNTRDVGEMFNVSPATVRNIMSGKRHRKITENL